MCIVASVCVSACSCMCVCRFAYAQVLIHQQKHLRTHIVFPTLVVDALLRTRFNTQCIHACTLKCSQCVFVCAYNCLLALYLHTVPPMLTVQCRTYTVCASDTPIIFHAHGMCVYANTMRSAHAYTLDCTQMHAHYVHKDAHTMAQALCTNAHPCTDIPTK